MEVEKVIKILEEKCFHVTNLEFSISGCYVILSRMGRIYIIENLENRNVKGKFITLHTPTAQRQTLVVWCTFSQAFHTYCLKGGYFSTLRRSLVYWNQLVRV